MVETASRGKARFMTLTNRALEICHPPRVPVSACWGPQTYRIKLPDGGPHIRKVFRQCFMLSFWGPWGKSSVVFTVPWMKVPYFMLSWSSPFWRPPACQNAPKHVTQRREHTTQLGQPMLSGVSCENWVTICQAFQQPLLEPAGTLPPGCRGGTSKGSEKPMRA